MLTCHAAAHQELEAEIDASSLRAQEAAAKVSELSNEVQSRDLAIAEVQKKVLRDLLFCTVEQPAIPKASLLLMSGACKTPRWTFHAHPAGWGTC